MKELYTIKQGNHSASGINFNAHFGIERLSFSITPDANCLYDLGNNNNYDINKFFGLTWGLDPLKNSFRIGWNCAKQNGMIQYYYYIHNNGKRNPGPTDDPFKTLIYESLPGIEKRFLVTFHREQILVGVVDETLDSIPFNFQGVPNWGVYNHLYFGGNQTAPHDMTVRIIRY